ncbi:uncharacterized protein YrzB (UPF0473 family) [Anaerotaenia torta]|uniref:DUF1292 domain-containing protein n=1 Tax=Anaerotaenia torta TaxID=433293 RepID=UPI003D22A76A
MNHRPDEINFITEDGEEIIFQVLEQTRLGGTDYLLVSTTEEEDEEAEALILRDISQDTDEEAVYDIVEDEKELQSVAAIFKELLDDIELY